MKTITLRDKILIGVIIGCIAISAIILIFNNSDQSEERIAEVENLLPPSEYLYGICIDSLNVINSEVQNGETLSTLLANYGVTQTDVNKMVEAGKDVFDARAFRGGNKYTMLMSNDSLPVIKYFVYEQNKTDFIVFNLSDTISVSKEQKEIIIDRLRKSATIKTSLWNAMIDEGMNAALAMNLSDVYQWSIDFYGIQENDAFNVIYDDHLVEGKSIGVGTIHGAWFDHAGRKHYAIRFEYTDSKGDLITGYWDEEGKSLKSMFLKAPLKYSRVSSRFSHSRLHPVLRIRRPHLGVDYAAPSGTPVQAIADGVVTFRAYKGANGNYIKIRHAQNYSSGYLHLKGFARGITVGSRVQQGQIIGYVGSTGISTGPHLDFRIWRGSQAIDPLKLGNTKREDLSDKYKPDFFKVRDRIIAELEGREYIEPVIDSLSTNNNIPKEQN